MNLKERIDDLNRKCNINSYVDLLIKIYRKLDYPYPQKEAQKQKSNFTQMLLGNRALKKEFYIPMEQIYHVTMDYIINGNGICKIDFNNGGLRYTAATNDYKMFELLGTETYENDSLVIFNSDEYNKTIFDYIVEYDAIEGLRYLANKYSIKYNMLHNSITCNHFRCFCTGEAIEKILEMIISKDEAGIYDSIFDSYQMLLDYYGERSIFSNRDYLIKILNSDKIFESVLTIKEFSLNEINMGLQLEVEKKSLFMNPLVKSLLVLALEDPNKYRSKIEKMLNFGISKNEEIIDYVVSHYDNGIDEYRIDEKGTIFYGHTKYGQLLNPGEVINPSLDMYLRTLIIRIKNINDKLIFHDVKDFFGNNHKKIKYNERGHILKLSSNNELEYELHRKYENLLPIPKYYGTKDGIDEFEKYRGQQLTYLNALNYDLNKVVEIAKFLRTLHDTTMNSETKEVFVHGDISLSNFYFTDGVLTDVINWDDVYIGDIYEDMMWLLINLSGMNDRYRDNQKVISNIKQIFDNYKASNEYKDICITKLRELIDEKILYYAEEQFPKDEESIFSYESFLWCKSFIDIYYNELKK